MNARSDGPVVIGIDLGGTNMAAGVVDSTNTIIGRARKKTKADQGQERVIGRLHKLVSEACAEAEIEMSDLACVGIVAPGAVDIPNGVVLEAPNLGWENTPLRDLLSERLGRPVALDNDVNGAIWGEYRLGAAQGRGDVLGVWVGTGVGGGLVIDGRLYHGHRFTAGEIGQTIVMPNQSPGLRTLEDHASRTGMSRIIMNELAQHPKSILHEIVDTENGVTGSSKLAKAVDAGDELANRVVDDGARLLGIGIANCVTVLSLDAVVVGGGVTEALGKGYISKIRASFEREVFPDRCRACDILMTKLEDDAGVFGAAAIARESLD